MAEKKLLNDEFAQFETMTNVELRGELKRRGYSTTGNKKDLLAKLHSAVEKEQKQPLLETNLTAAVSSFLTRGEKEEKKISFDSIFFQQKNVMNFENEDEKEKLVEQPKSTSINDETKPEENSSIDEQSSTPVERQDEFSSTNNKENIQKRGKIKLKIEF